MENKVALVMGAGDNLGSAISKCFANEGYTVVAARRNGEKLNHSKRMRLKLRVEFFMVIP